MNGIIDKIEQLRLEKHWSKYRLAEEAMLTYSTLSAMYLRDTPPKIEILESICNALGITLAQFFLNDEQTEIVTPDEKALLQNYRRLSEKKKQAILTLSDQP